MNKATPLKNMIFFFSFLISIKYDLSGLKGKK